MGLLQRNGDKMWLKVAAGALVFGAVAAWRSVRSDGESSKTESSTNGSRGLAAAQFNEERGRRNRRALKVLAGWSLANLGSGIRGYLKSEGARRFFHEMNAGWGAISAATATVSYLKLRRSQQGPDPTLKGLRRAHGLEKLLLADMAVAVGGLGVGAYLSEKGRRIGSERLQGYGPSLMIQGAYFLFFDATLFVRTNRHRRAFEHKISPMERIKKQEPEQRV